MVINLSWVHTISMVPFNCRHRCTSCRTTAYSTWIHCCTILSWFCFGIDALGSWYLGTLLDTHLWPNHHPCFPYASRWSPRYYTSWLHLNQRSFLLSHALRHSVRSPNNFRFIILSILQLDDHFRSCTRYFHQLNS